MDSRDLDKVLKAHIDATLPKLRYARSTIRTFYEELSDIRVEALRLQLAQCATGATSTGVFEEKLSYWPISDLEVSTLVPFYRYLSIFGSAANSGESLDLVQGFVSPADCHFRSKVAHIAATIWPILSMEQALPIQTSSSDSLFLTNQKLQNRYYDLRSKIFNSLTYIIIRELRRFSTVWPHFEDIFNEGAMGLLESIDRCDIYHSKGYEGYASAYTYGFMVRRVGEIRRIVRLPFHMEERISRLKRSLRADSEAWSAFSHNRGPTDGGFSEFIENDLRTALIQPVSLDEFRDMENSEFNSQDLSLGSNPKSQNLDLELVHNLVESVLLGFNERDRKAFILYFLEEGFTLEAVGQQIGLTRERVRQIIDKICDKCKIRGGSFYDYWIFDYHHEGRIDSRGYGNIDEGILSEIDPSNYFSSDSIRFRKIIDTSIKGFYKLPAVQHSASHNHNQDVFINPLISDLIGS